jgi:hypothetical protein
MARWTRFDRAAAAFCLVAFATTFSMRRLGDFDLHWHLASGRQIALEHSVPRIDDLTYTHPRIRYTEFLSDLGLYAIMRAAGPTGLQLLGGLLALGIGALIFVRARRAGPVAMIATAFALVTMAPWVIVRPATLSFLFFGLVVLLIDNHRRGIGRPWQLALIVPVQLAWCNMHQGATLGVALVIGYLAYRVIARFARGRWPRFLPASDGRDLPRVLLVAALATLATGMNTAGFQYLTGLQYAEPMHVLATEWSYVSLQFALREPLWLLFVASALLALVFGFGPDGKRAWPDLFDVGLTIAALLISFYQRFIPITAVALSPIIAHRIGPAISRSPLFRALGLAIPLATAPLTLLRFHKEVGAGFYWPHFPRAAIDFVRGTHPAGPMWNFSPFGGYIEWAAYPAYRTFVDGRILNMAIARRAYRGEFESAAFAELAEQFGMQWAICRAAEGEAFCLPIANRADWTMVFWDDVSAVYVDRRGPNASIASGGYRVFRHTASFEQTLWHAVAGADDELAAIAHDGYLALAQAPQSPRAAFLGACGALAARDRARFDSTREALARLAPNHPAIALLDNAWTAAVSREGAQHE